MEVHRDCSHNLALFATLSRKTSTTKHKHTITSLQSHATSHKPQATSHQQPAGTLSEPLLSLQLVRFRAFIKPALRRYRTPPHAARRSISSIDQSIRAFNRLKPTIQGPKQHRAAVRVLCSSRPESAGIGDRAFVVSLTKAPSSASQSSRSLARCTPPGTERHYSSSSNPYVYLSIYRDLSPHCLNLLPTATPQSKWHPSQRRVSCCRRATPIPRSTQPHPPPPPTIKATPPYKSAPTSNLHNARSSASSCTNGFYCCSVSRAPWPWEPRLCCSTTSSAISSARYPSAHSLSSLARSIVRH